MPDAGEASETSGTRTGGKSYGTWKESMDIKAGRVNEDWESSEKQFLQSVCSNYVAMWLWSKNQVERSTNFIKLEKELDSIALLSTIKKLIYTASANDLNVRHNKAMVHMNLINLYQDKFQDIQEFKDQYMAMQKVCKELGLKFGRCTNDVKAVLKEKAI